jgi:hypothetical protein
MENTLVIVDKIFLPQLNVCKQGGCIRRSRPKRKVSQIFREDAFQSQGVIDENTATEAKKVMLTIPSNALSGESLEMLLLFPPKVKALA